MFNNNYAKYIINQLKLYTNRMDKLTELCLINNQNIYMLFKIIQKRSFTNIFRRNNNLINLYKLYNMINNMLINYSINNNSTDLNNYSCFYMLVKVFIFVKKMNHLNTYFKHDGILIELLVLIRQEILKLAYLFLNNINSSYEKKVLQTNSLVPNIEKISLSSNVSQKNNKQKYYEDRIYLYIQFLSMYNLITIDFMNTFDIKTYSKSNLTNTFIDGLRILYNNISSINKNLFKEYIKYIGRTKVGIHVSTEYNYILNKNMINKKELIKGLYHQEKLL